ncbi:unnamed protein product [Schistosoma intercalatum]|nr:unnamed protein product [Schistosoma intercalatum]
MAAKSKRLLKVIDGIRSWNISSSQPNSSPKSAIEIDEYLKSEHFQVGKISVHGFPHQPTCIAFDPVQRIVAVGTKCGFIRIFGRPGVDCSISHPSASAVLQIFFLVNEGGLVSICGDDVAHLWNIRQKNPEIVHSLQFKREHLTCAPGEAVPDDYIFYEPIRLVEWLPTRNGEPFIIFSGGGRSPGAQTVIHSSVATTNVSSTSLPNSDSSENDPNLSSSSSCMISSNHMLTIKRGKKLVVLQLDHKLVQFTTLCMSPYTSETMDPYAVAILLQEDLVVIDLLSTNFATFENPYPMDLHSSPVTSCLYLVDCPGDLIPAFYSVSSRRNRTQSGTCAEPDVFSSREWPITGGEWRLSNQQVPELIITGHADGSVRFWDASEVSLTPLYKFRTSKLFANPSTSTSNPVETGSTSLSDAKDINAHYSSILLATESDTLAIHFMHFCSDSRKLLTASSYHTCLLHFSRRDINLETAVMDINMAYDGLDDIGFAYSAGDTFSDDHLNTAENLSGNVTKDTVQQSLPHVSSGSVSSYQSASPTERDLRVFVPVRQGSHHWPPGYQPLLVCRVGILGLSFESNIKSSTDPTASCLIPPPSITAISMSSAFSLMAIGSEFGIAVVDYVHKICLLSISSSDLLSRGPINLTGSSASGEVKFCDQSFYSGPIIFSGNISPSILDQSFSNNPMEDSVSYLVSGAFTSINHRNDFTDTHKKRQSRIDIFQSTQKCLLSKANSSIDKRHRIITKYYYTDVKVINSLLKNNSSAGSTSLANTCIINNQTALKSVHSNSDAAQSSESPSTGYTTRYVLSRTTTVKSELKRAKSQVVLACRTNQSSRQQGQTSNAQNTSSEKCSDLSQFSHPGSLTASSSSLDNLNCETIKTILFSEWISPKQDLHFVPNLWIGTSRGCVLALNLKYRVLNNVPINHSYCIASLYRLRGDIIHISLLDNTGDILPSPSERWDDSFIFKGGAASELSKQASLISCSSICSEGTSMYTNADAYSSTDTGFKSCGGGGSVRALKESVIRQNTVTTHTSSTSTSSHSSTILSNTMSGGVSTFQSSGTTGLDSPTTSKGFIECDRQLVVLCSEKQARVVALPSQNCLYKVKITETSQVVRASVQRLRPSHNSGTSTASFLACYLANGHFVAFSLPSLRLLMDVDYLPYTECVSRSFAFGQYGQSVYLVSPSELAKITWASDVCANLRDMQGEIFLPSNMPEPPKKNFFKNLLSGTLVSSLDRDELFGEASSGKGTPGATTLLPNARLEKLSGQTGAASTEIARARNAAIERGERLQQLDLQTQEMADQAKGFGRSAAILAAKYEKKDKRWGLPF